MIMKLVPTKDDAIWFGVGYIGAMAHAVDNLDEVPFTHVPGHSEWLESSYKEGASLGLRVRTGEVPIPEFHNQDTSTVVLLVTAGLMGPKEIATLLDRWCSIQKFTTYTKADGRLAALNAYIEGNGEGMMQKKIERIMEKIAKQVGADVKVLKVSKETMESLSEDAENSEEQTPSTPKKKLLN